ncbi:MULTISPECIES: bifunctional 3-(3-hydroxy-phenyl)propionate/3-hydroxycinnamic acid hydroxylase [Hydrocarboniphaga]|nr:MULTISPECIES: bifunctional 3-(3-hydroxy-phenyl)propionate/3-hydroxycinnamic acid hydroxylase [Hydrocarboniphaga]MDZ4081278.1 bifunctional 3-(3-hydroxy-phenyl)propionate/3-hydroxycinnamic acid hydroxylase [Hydrocarboniphaga sp.]
MTLDTSSQTRPMHGTIESVDVLVVGYGPVGAALAALLGRYGVSTLVIDKAADILMSPRAIALDNEALRILQATGLAEDAFDRIVIPQVRMLCPHVGLFGRVNTRGDIDGHPKLVTFYQPDLERALRALVASHASVRAWLATEMIGFVDEGDCVTVALRESGGRERTVRARYLIGADGAGSQVRKAIGQGFTGRTYAEDWLIVDARNVPGDFDHVEFICDSQRPTPHMVAPGGRTRWEFMLRPGETREQMERDDTIKSLLSQWANTDDIRIERKAVYRFHARCCERFSRGRVFLIGDAAHVTPPFVGQGLVAGLRDAMNLAWKLASVIDGRAAPAILDSYDIERRPHAAKMIRLAKFMGKLVMPRNKLMAILVHGSMAALRLLPALRRHFDELGVKPKNEFPDGLFVRGRRRGGLKRGAQIPQGLVRGSDGTVLLSDDALGSGLVLVGFGVDASAHLAPATRQAWSAIGGSSLQLRAYGTGASASEAYECLDIQLMPRAAATGWCAVVRPDRTVLHDGPASEADRLVRASIDLLTRHEPRSRAA